MVLCHDENRLAMKGYEREGLPVPSLRECIAMYEEAAAWRRPPGYPRARVVAVALNTAGFDDEDARRHIDGAAHLTKLAVADPVREGALGADQLAHAIIAANNAEAPEAAR